MNNRIRENFDLVAQKYDSQRKCFLPSFDDYYRTGVSLLRQYQKEFSEVLDLGAGTGLLTQFVYEQYPHARYTLADISDEMLKVARERFQGLSDFFYLECDYAEGLPQGQYDLICSGLSIHHLTHPEKKKLYQNIYQSLEPGGCFLTLDQFICRDRLINELYDKWWFDYIDQSGIKPEDKSAWLKRKELDIENSAEETVEWLKEAGFQRVECLYRFMKFSVILCMK